MTGNLVLFVGAGFSKGINDKSPLAKELAARVMRELQDPSFGFTHQELNKIRTKFFGTLKTNEPPFEVLLLVLEQEWGPVGERTNKEAWHGLLGALGRATHFTLGYRQTMTHPKMAGLVSSLQGLARYFDKVSIVTTNYDINVDKAACWIADRVLGYPVPAKDSDNYPPDLARYAWRGARVEGLFEVHADKSTYLVPTLRKASSINGIVYQYKLHGSVNMAWCSNCGQLHHPASYGALKELHSGTLLNCAACGKGPYEGIIVPPTPLKDFKGPLPSEWERAKDALANANYVVFIGYSLPPEDHLVLRLLLNSHAKANWTYGIWTTGTEAVERYEEVFGPCDRRLKQIGEFDPTTLRDFFSRI